MLGAIIGAATSLGAGLLQRKDNAKAQEQDYQRQKEFAQSGITWKVEDARRAGIHPAVALGAQTASFSPIGVGDTGTGQMAQAGQDISRAIDTTRTATSRISAFDQTVRGLTLQKMGLENELLASQVAKVKQQVGPPMSGDDYLVPGQTASGLDIPIMHAAKQPQFTTNLRAFGKDILPSPKASDAQSYEDRYGEMSDYIAGPYIAIQDYLHNVAPYVKRNIYDKLRR